MTASTADAAQPTRERVAARSVTGWRHARAIALLPFTNTVVIPAAILLWTRGADLLASTSHAAAIVPGAVLLSAGVALVAHSIRLFVHDGQGTLAPWDPTRELVTRGAYRYLRNPMKAGLFLVLLGEAVLLRSLPLLSWFAAFAAVNVAYIRVIEEPGLRKRFGPAYDHYSAMVPRWLPRLRSVAAAVDGQGGSE